MKMLEPSLAKSRNSKEPLNLNLGLSCMQRCTVSQRLSLTVSRNYKKIKRKGGREGETEGGRIV